MGLKKSSEKTSRLAAEVLRGKTPTDDESRSLAASVLSQKEGGGSQQTKEIVMARGQGRYAVVLKETGEVISIHLMEGDSKPFDGKPREGYEIVEVDHDVAVGMVKSGKGFAWPDRETAVANDADAGADIVKAKKPRGKKADAGADDEPETPPKPEGENPDAPPAPEPEAA